VQLVRDTLNWGRWSHSPNLLDVFVGMVGDRDVEGLSHQSPNVSRVAATFTKRDDSRRLGSRAVSTYRAGLVSSSPLG